MRQSLDISGPSYMPQQVACCGHQRILVVGGINAWRRYHMDAVVTMGALNVDAANMGAAIVQAERAKATVVAWVDKLGDPVRFRPVRITELGGWRKIAPHRAPDAIVELIREIWAYAVTECRERVEGEEGEPLRPVPWFTALKDGKQTPCELNYPGAEPDLGRWCHWLHHGHQDPYEGHKPLRL